MADLFVGHSLELTSPLPRSEVADLSSGDHDFTNSTRAIVVATDGDIVIRLIGDREDLKLTGVKASIFPVPFRVKVDDLNEVARLCLGREAKP